MQKLCKLKLSPYTVKTIPAVHCLSPAGLSFLQTAGHWFPFSSSAYSQTCHPQNLGRSLAALYPNWKLGDGKELVSEETDAGYIISMVYLDYDLWLDMTNGSKINCAFIGMLCTKWNNTITFFVLMQSFVFRGYVLSKVNKHKPWCMTCWSLYFQTATAKFWQ